LATLYEIAKESGVSHSTVSRVLSGKMKMSAVTTKKIMDAAHKLGYNSSYSIQIPPSQAKTQTIGMVTQTHLSHPFFFNVYDTIYSTLDQMGYSLLLNWMNNTNANQSNVDFIKAFDGKVDGIIFVGQLPVDGTLLEPFIKKKCPMVSLLNKINVPGLVNIDANTFQGAYDATTHLIKLGHKRIAHILGHGTNIHSLQRRDGYIKALEDNQIPVDFDIIKVGNFSYVETYRCSLDLLNDFDDLTAVFCCTDEMATAFIDAAKDKGLKIPADISVVGFDDVKSYNFLADNVPFITTIRQPRQEMAVYAVKVLIDRIHGGEVPIEKIFQLELIIRNSTSFRKQ
jgi:DNA-binding LacI/PurR family transcriptional regulator